ncbi:MAG TPA: hypothetical protein VLG50_00815 [Candidatus Saccharimonadales bacterium]|nr:hypothetical protein [Candidatus Saccharimonadales bacterium]
MIKLKIVKLLVIICIHLISFQTITNTEIGQIIVTHGISSGGKTSIVEELSLQIGKPKTEIMNCDKYMRSAIDQKALECGYNLDENKQNWWQDFFKVTKHLTEKERKDFSLQTKITFFKSIKESALNGKIVLVDTIDRQDIAFFRKYMGDIKVTVVLIYTPLNNIIKFLESRNNSAANENNKRSLLMSLTHYQYNFKPVENDSDYSIDTLDRDTVQHYFNYVNQEPFWYQQKPENFEQEFIQHFKLDQMSSIKITSVLQYDIILHQSELPVFQRAQFLKNVLLL